MTDKSADHEHLQQEEALREGELQEQSFGNDTDHWSEGHEPVDSFSDDHDDVPLESDEDMAAVETEDETDQETEAPARKSMLIPVVAAVVGTLFVGSMMYMQFSGSSSAPTPMPISEALNQGASTEAPLTTGSQFDGAQADALSTLPGLPPIGGRADQPTTGGSVTDPLTTTAPALPPLPGNAQAVAPKDLPADQPQNAPSGLVPASTAGAEPVPAPSPAPVPAAVPAPAPVVAVTPALPAVPSATPALPLAESVAPAAVAPAKDQPKTASKTPAPSLTAPTPSGAAALVPPPAASAATDKAAQDKIDKLVARVETLQKALDQSTQQLTQMSAIVTNLQAAGASVSGSGASSASPELMDRLNRLEQKVATTKAEPAPRGVDVAEPVAPKKATVAHVEKHKKIAQHKTEATKKHASAVAEEKKVSGWVLRAATPDAAWVSKGPHQDELIQLTVGQEVKGVGRVTAIQQRGNMWVVVGTKGVIQ